MELRRKLCVVLSLLSCAGLAACSTVVASGAFLTAHHYLSEEDPNFAAQNYAVADFLIQQANTFVKPDSLIMAEPLTDIQTPEISTTIARLIPEQIGVRLSQLGYLVDLGAVTTTADTNYLRPSLKSNTPPEFLLTGHYLRKNSRDIDVKVRIVDLQRDRIIAVFDYTMHLSHGVKELAQPKPKITIIGPDE